MRYADRTAAEWKNVAYATRRRRRSREQKVLGMIGVAAHECGHINFSNFEKRRIYASGIREGILYPELPEPKNEEEKQVLGELQVCLEQKKEKELRVIRETLLYLHNILEDMYIEARQCAEYGGIVQKAIRFLGRWDMEQAESIRQMQEYGMDSLSIMKNVLLQYLRSKKVNDWERAGGIYMEMLERCKETLDEVVIPADEDVRFRAANRLLLILWEFVKEAFEQEESGKEDTQNKFPLNMKAAMELGNGKSPQPQIQRKGKKKEDVRLPFWAGNSRKRQPRRIA